MALRRQIAAAFIGILLSFHAVATVAVLPSVEALAAGSDAVIRGRVLARESRWSGKRIQTFTRVRADATWRGQADSELMVVTPGGVVGDIGQKVHGAPSMEAGEEVVLFLRRDGPLTYRVNGLAIGKFRVEGSVAKPSLEGMRVLEARGRSTDAERRVEPMPLSELERRVRTARP
jgi:hypothetical protein